MPVKSVKVGSMGKHSERASQVSWGSCTKCIPTNSKEYEENFDKIFKKDVDKDSEIMDTLLTDKQKEAAERRAKLRSLYPY